MTFPMIRVICLLSAKSNTSFNTIVIVIAIAERPRRSSGVDLHVFDLLSV